MAGDNLAACCGHFGDFRAHPLVKRGKPRGIGFRIAAIQRLIAWIDGDQPSSDIAGVVLRQAQILPSMRVRHLPRPNGMIVPPTSTAMIMPVMMMRLHHARRDAIGCGHQGALEAGRPDHAIQPTFKAKPIADYHRRIGQRGGV